MPADKSLRTPTVSVAVPSYNHEKFVAACLKSIFEQSFQPMKLVVIDDGSSDNSCRVIDSTLRDCPFPCEFIARENRGLPATLNQSLELTAGDYFAYLGSDDIWLKDFLSERIKLLHKRRTAVLGYGHSYFIDDENKVVDCTADWASYKDGNVRKMLLTTVAPMSPTVLYVRSALARHGWNENGRLEDFELYLKLSLEGEFAFDPKPLSAWRWHDTNTSRDQYMMLQEHEAALRNLASDFDLNKEDLESLLKTIRFNRAEEFLRLGDKQKAFELLKENWSASARLLPIATRLLLPYSAVSWWRRRRQQKASRKYGRLEL